MKTIRITRQGFPNVGQHSWMRYFQFILSKKYNVIVDSINPDLIIQSDLNYNENQIDTYTGQLPAKFNPSIDKNKKFIYVSGEVADFRSPLINNDNVWSIGYNKFEHPRYLRQPSCVFDVWTIYDEARLTDCPLCWLTEKRDFQKIKNRNTDFCCITQSSDNIFRGQVFDILSTYKTVKSSGPWRQNLFGNDTLNRYQWQNHLFTGRIDGLTYREKIEFFYKFKFNISIHFTNTPYIIQEKIFHSYFAGCVPIFFGNQFILEEGFNPESFINLHEFSDLNDFLDLVKRIDSDENLYKKYIETPIFVDNNIPDYFDFEYTLSFLEKVIES